MLGVVQKSPISSKSNQNNVAKKLGGTYYPLMLII